jgi:hypothetical protein
MGTVMEIPTFGGISLFNSSEDPCAGGAFELLDPAREGGLVDVDGW